MTVKQKRLLHLFSGAIFLAIPPGFPVLKSEIYGVNGDEDDLAVRLFWRDNEDCEWVSDFTEKALSQAILSRGMIQLVDSIGELVTLTKFKCIPC